MEIRIEATDLPGRTVGPGAGFEGADGVHVGVQRKDRPDELLDLWPGDAASAVWTLDCAVAPSPDPTEADLGGRYVQNRFGRRFVYLSWGTVDAAGTFTMFRRAKLVFDPIPQDVVRSAVRSGRLTARLRLTDARGGPLCGSVRPPLVEWSAGQSPGSPRT